MNKVQWVLGASERERENRNKDIKVEKDRVNLKNNKWCKWLEDKVCAGQVVGEKVEKLIGERQMEDPRSLDSIFSHDPRTVFWENGAGFIPSGSFGHPISVRKIAVDLREIDNESQNSDVTVGGKGKMDSRLRLQKFDDWFHPMATERDQARWAPGLNARRKANKIKNWSVISE